jgi:hypothetical protein
MTKVTVRAVQIIRQHITFTVEVPDSFDGETVTDEPTFAARAVSSQSMYHPDCQSLGQFVEIDDSEDEEVLDTIVCEVEVE